MSIFPKRTIPGKPVTIHWNLHTAHLEGKHISPYVRIGVRDPLGRETMLLENHILILPNDPDAKDTGGKQESRQLQNHFPWLILVDCLSGPRSRKELMTILERIRTGKHFYFTFQTPEDAPLGRYEIISEMYIEGLLRYSATAEDDHFFVEALELRSVTRSRTGRGYRAEVKNPSPEQIPARIVECSYRGTKLKTDSRLISFPPLKATEIRFHSDKTFLLFNEEREIIPLRKSFGPLIVRNQQLFSVPGNNQAGDVTFVMPIEGDEALPLTGSARILWEKVARLTTRDEVLSGLGEEILIKFLAEGLLRELWLSEEPNHRRGKERLSRPKRRA